QWTLGAGQCSAQMYQCDHNTLIHDPLMALGGEDAPFSFAEMGPSFRVDYFDHRGQGSAAGHYLTVAVPFSRRLCLNADCQVGSPQGVCAHAFQRRGQNTLGVYSYARGGSYLGGLIATRELVPNLFLTGAATLGDLDGHRRLTTLEGEYVVNPR